MKTTNYITHYRELLRLGVPIMIGQAGNIVLSFADTLMVGHHGTSDLAAASFVNCVFNLCVIFGTGFSLGLTPVVGGHYANRRFAEAGQATLCSQVANLLTAVLMMVAMGVVYACLDLLGQPRELMPLIRPYFLTLLFSLPFLMLFLGFKQFTDGIASTGTAMWVLIGGNALNIVGNYLLIYGKLGLPELGLLGAGISTLVARVLMVVAYVVVLLCDRRFVPYLRGARRLRWSSAVFRRLQSLGWPVALQMGMETASFTVSGVMVGWIGTVALASHQIMITVSQFTFMINCGMGAAVSVRVSHFHGRGETLRARQTAYAGLHLMLIIVAVLMTCLFFLRHRVGYWFTDSEEVCALVASLFFPFALFQFGDLLQINFSAALRGIADVKPMMWMAFVAYFIISIPAGYLCGFTLGYGAPGVWMAFPFGLTAAGLMFLHRFRRKTGRNS